MKGQRTATVPDMPIAENWDEEALIGESWEQWSLTFVDDDLPDISPGDASQSIAEAVRHAIREIVAAYASAPTMLRLDRGRLADAHRRLQDAWFHSWLRDIQCERSGEPIKEVVCPLAYGIYPFRCRFPRVLEFLRTFEELTGYRIGSSNVEGGLPGLVERVTGIPFTRARRPTDMPPMENDARRYLWAFVKWAEGYFKRVIRRTIGVILSRTIEKQLRISKGEMEALCGGDCPLFQFPVRFSVLVKNAELRSGYVTGRVRLGVWCRQEGEPRSYGAAWMAPRSGSSPDVVVSVLPASCPSPPRGRLEVCVFFYRRPTQSVQSFLGRFWRFVDRARRLANRALDDNKHLIYCSNPCIVVEEPPEESNGQTADVFYHCVVVRWDCALKGAKPPAVPPPPPVDPPDPGEGPSTPPEGGEDEEDDIPGRGPIHYAPQPRSRVAADLEWVPPWMMLGEQVVAP